MVCELVGVPEQDSQKLRVWTDALLRSFDSTEDAEGLAERQAEGSAALGQYLSEATARLDHPPGSLLHALARRRWDGPDLDFEASDAEVVGACFLFLIAGYETTVNLLATGTHSLLHNPSQLELLRNNPALLDSAIEEMLRFESPIQRASLRTRHGGGPRPCSAPWNRCRW